MGILNFLKNQFIEVIEWLDDSQDTMVYRFPVEGQEIKMGAKLTVRESQMAVFINEGKAADTFGPGLYTLSTQNLPILTDLRSWPYGFNSPFKAEVYFFNTKQFTNQKWGTENPIMLRDAEFGMLRLRAFGIYSFRLSDPLKFLQQISGTSGDFETGGTTEQLKRMIISGLTDLLGEAKIPALDLAANYDEISGQAQKKLDAGFQNLGLKLESFYVENISLPPEVEKMLDTRTQMNMAGNLSQYAQFQAANSIQDAAKNPGGMAGAGIGLGAGAVMGSAFYQAFAPQPQAPAPAQPQSSGMAACAQCGASVPEGSKFCPKCGNPVNQAARCVKCGSELQPGVKFCPQCGAPQSGPSVCKTCGKEMNPDEKFCPQCGTKV